MSVRYVCADCESHTGLLSRGGAGEFNLAGSRLYEASNAEWYWCVLSSHFRSPASNMSYMSVGLL